ncbi:OLC1v1035051C1 [Oldenlandia corymbosa var. corymbosa]|uniref:OLC1v1035051C1 n=1 Tax=Oldenlandia corymbosa var. corymbosa TaxID=529605 RepID=A0AAV1CSM1_OLDCO|nr:OLC1v1035051C1 [Oldenlandia corymbosa var. corymbosa]
MAISDTCGNFDRLDSVIFTDSGVWRPLRPAERIFNLVLNSSSRFRDSFMRMQLLDPEDKVRREIQRLKEQRARGRWSRKLAAKAERSARNFRAFLNSDKVALENSQNEELPEIFFREVSGRSIQFGSLHFDQVDARYSEVASSSDSVWFDRAYARNSEFASSSGSASFDQVNAQNSEAAISGKVSIDQVNARSSGLASSSGSLGSLQTDGDVPFRSSPIAASPLTGPGFYSSGYVTVDITDWVVHGERSYANNSVITSSSGSRHLYARDGLDQASTMVEDVPPTPNRQEASSRVDAASDVRTQAIPELTNRLGPRLENQNNDDRASAAEASNVSENHGSDGSSQIKSNAGSHATNGLLVVKRALASENEELHERIAREGLGSSIQFGSLHIDEDNVQISQVVGSSGSVSIDFNNEALENSLNEELLEIIARRGSGGFIQFGSLNIDQVESQNSQVASSSRSASINSNKEALKNSQNEELHEIIAREGSGRSMQFGSLHFGQVHTQNAQVASSSGNVTFIRGNARNPEAPSSSGIVRMNQVNAQNSEAACSSGSMRLLQTGGAIPVHRSPTFASPHAGPEFYQSGYVAIDIPDGLVEEVRSYANDSTIASSSGGEHLYVQDGQAHTSTVVEDVPPTPNIQVASSALDAASGVQIHGNPVQPNAQHASLETQNYNDSFPAAEASHGSENHGVYGLAQTNTVGARPTSSLLDVNVVICGITGQAILSMMTSSSTDSMFLRFCAGATCIGFFGSFLAIFASKNRGIAKVMTKIGAVGAAFAVSFALGATALKDTKWHLNALATVISCLISAVVVAKAEL